MVVYVLLHACLSSHFMLHNITKINEEVEQKLGVGSCMLGLSLGRCFAPFVGESGINLSETLLG